MILYDKDCSTMGNVALAQKNINPAPSCGALDSAGRLFYAIHPLSKATGFSGRGWINHPLDKIFGDMTARWTDFPTASVTHYSFSSLLLTTAPLFL